MLADLLSDERHAEPGALAVVARDASEGLEDGGAVLRRDARTVVVHAQHRPVGAERHLDAPAVAAVAGGGLEGGVDDQPPAGPPTPPDHPPPGGDAGAGRRPLPP